MTTVREDIEDLFYGHRPVRRQNPKAGESEWFYMTPKNPDDLEERYTYTDVPTQVLPKPLNYLANEYINRYAPDWLNDFYKK